MAAVVGEPLFDLLHECRIVWLVYGVAPEPATVADLSAESSGPARLAHVTVDVPTAWAAESPLFPIGPYGGEGTGGGSKSR